MPFYCLTVTDTRKEDMIMNQKKKSTPRFWLCISLLICLISCLGASMIQTNFGHVTVKDLRFETESGHQMSALLFIPDTATAENPAPAIVCSHGWYNNREMQDLNYVEYARRGYVVLSIDMYGHGNSDILPAGDWWKPENNANGMYDAVKMMATLPFVDKEKIGVTGHSNGALASRTAVLLDNEAEEPLIASALLVSNDAVYTDEEGAYFNMFGNRDAGIVACQYDEFFHRTYNEDGSHTAPRDFLKQANAQSFLYFGQDPAGLESRASETIYSEEIDGKEALRVIYNPAITHPWAHFSKQVVTSSVQFFEESLGAPNPIDGNNQLWQIKVFFNALGLVGFIMFVISFAKVLLGTQCFASLKSSEEVAPAPAPQGRVKQWFWISNILASVFSFVVYMFGYSVIAGLFGSISPQAGPAFIGIWAALCGLFSLFLLWLGKKYTKAPSDTAENGVKISLKKFGLTLVLALVVAVSAYGLVFLADYFFKTDFRLWVVTLKAFDADLIPYILLYLPLFLLYYIPNSICINSYNYFEMGKRPWINTCVNVIFNILPSVVMVAIMYGCFFISGYLPNEFFPFFGGSIIGIWLYPVIIVLAVAAVASRKLYRATKNPYLAGIIMAVLVAIMSCTNTLTQF